jgi:predicted transcriptional regulator
LADLCALIDEGLADIEAGRIIEDFNLNEFLAERRRAHAEKRES